MCNLCDRRDVAINALGALAATSDNADVAFFGRFIALANADVSGTSETLADTMAIMNGILQEGDSDARTVRYNVFVALHDFTRIGAKGCIVAKDTLNDADADDLIARVVGAMTARPAVSTHPN